MWHYMCTESGIVNLSNRRKLLRIACSFCGPFLSPFEIRRLRLLFLRTEQLQKKARGGGGSGAAAAGPVNPLMMGVNPMMMMGMNPAMAMMSQASFSCSKPCVLLIAQNAQATRTCVAIAPGLSSAVKSLSAGSGYGKSVLRILNWAHMAKLFGWLALLSALWAHFICSWFCQMVSFPWQGGYFMRIHLSNRHCTHRG